MRAYLRKYYISVKYLEEAMKKNLLAEEIIGNKEKTTFLAAGQKTWRGNAEPREWKKGFVLLAGDDKCQ